MFIELTSWHTGLKALISLNQVTDIYQGKKGRVIIGFDENNFMIVKESYEEIRNLLSREGVLI